MQSAPPYVVVWRVPDQTRSRQQPIIGFVADLAFITDIFARIVSESPLLPPSLGGHGGSLLSVRIVNDDGRRIFASSSSWSQYESDNMLEGELGALRLSVALQPSAAESLIIGGLPRNRLPLLGGLLVLTTGLVVVALIQWRRERELGRLRADFISGVSHELRTPLAQIRMFGEMLLLGRVRSPAEHRRSLAIIVQESQRLTRLIENVLHFSRSDRGASFVAPHPVRLDLLVREIVESFEPLARSKRASITTRIEEGLVVPVDSEAMRQMMLNLLDNALKYGPAGQTITVAVVCHEGSAHVSIEDQGPGVRVEDVGRIWEPFYRGADHAESTGGTGIGLAIVKQLVERHRGRARVEDGTFGGARFIIELPDASRADGGRVGQQATAIGA
jgi:signal transduction histidine kinase